jgi:hypothetical protein
VGRVLEVEVGAEIEVHTRKTVKRTVWSGTRRIAARHDGSKEATKD